MNLLNFESVLLDMDGTLLDGHFDDLFWNDWVAKAYAVKNRLTLDRARQQVQNDLQAVAGQLAWLSCCFVYYFNKLTNTDRTQQGPKK